MARTPQNSVIVEVGHVLHPCENDLVCWTTCGKVPFFNAPIYFENEEQIGKVDEIFGSPQEHGFSVKLGEGIKASSFKSDEKLFIESAKLLPIERFLPGAKPFRGGSRGRGGMRGQSRGNARGGSSRNSSFRGRGSSDRGSRGRGRGNSRGGFGNSRGGFGNSRGGSQKRRGDQSFSSAKKKRFD